MDLTPGIGLACPPEADATGPIPIDVDLAADARTYWDNDGLLHKALTVVLVRRDEPGLAFLPNLDPDVIMHPDEPLGDRPADEELDAYPGVITESRHFDAAGSSGTPHAGAADYFVTAAFSRWWAGLRSLRVRDVQDRRYPVVEQPRSIVVTPLDHVETGKRHGGVEIDADRSSGATELRIHFDASIRRDDEGKIREANRTQWLTVVGFNLRTRGGAAGGIFELATAGDRQAVPGETTIPLASLAPPIDPGRWVFLAFVGDDASPPTEIFFSDDDVR